MHECCFDDSELEMDRLIYNLGLFAIDGKELNIELEVAASRDNWWESVVSMRVMDSKQLTLDRHRHSRA